MEIETQAFMIGTLDSLSNMSTRNGYLVRNARGARFMPRILTGLKHSRPEARSTPYCRHYSYT